MNLDDYEYKGSRRTDYYGRKQTSVWGAIFGWGFILLLIIGGLSGN